MGYIRHHLIAVSSFDKDKIDWIHQKAKSIFESMVTDVLYSPVGAWNTFFIGPDGSKEGWDDSHKYDRFRDIFIELIEDEKYEDGSNAVRYCEFYFDENHSEVVRHN